MEIQEEFYAMESRSERSGVVKIWIEDEKYIYLTERDG